jgi:hypothetical protein
VKWFGNYGGKVSWIVKRYGNYGRKVSWIMKRFGKYRRKQWKPGIGLYIYRVNYSRQATW